MDNLYNATRESLKRVTALTGKTPAFENVDLLDVPGMEDLFKKNGFESVIHFAGLKAVGESVAKPLLCARPSSSWRAAPSLCRTWRGSNGQLSAVGSQL